MIRRVTRTDIAVRTVQITKVRWVILITIQLSRIDIEPTRSLSSFQFIMVFNEYERQIDFDPSIHIITSHVVLQKFNRRNVKRGCW